MKSRLLRVCLAACAALLLALATACASSDEVIVGVGTTVQDSGLLDVLVDEFEEQTDYKVKAVPAGTGQLLEMGRRGDADVLLTHDPAAEEAFFADGFGINRQLVMHNDFVVLGPVDDPVGIARAENATTALHGIRKSELPFISRGDDSGTHKLELRLWEGLDFDPTSESWYEETGQGMGATLQVANQRNAYTISDRGTYLATRDSIDLVILFEGDPRLLNVYHVMQVNPEKHPAVREDAAAAFVDFMLSDSTQQLIANFGVEEFGQPLFIPDAGKTEAGVGLVERPA